MHRPAKAVHDVAPLAGRDDGRRGGRETQNGKCDDHDLRVSRPRFMSRMLTKTRSHQENRASSLKLDASATL